MTEETKNVCGTENVTLVAKNVANRAKYVTKATQMKIVLKVTKYLLYLFLPDYYMAMCGLLQLCMVLYGH